MNILELMTKRIVFFDGAMGTVLQNKNMEPTPTLNLTNPKLIHDIHTSYLKAGCDIISTNTFGANPLKEKEVKKIIKAGVSIAKSAAADFKNKYVALDIGSLGVMMQPNGNLSFQDAYDMFSEMITACEKEQPDLILFETFNDLYEMKAAILAAKNHTNLPIFASMTYDAKGKLLTGADILSQVSLLEALGVDAMGINCSLGPDQILPLIETMLQYSRIPLLVQANAGMPTMNNGKISYPFSPETFTFYMKKMAQMGVSILGGCCGTTEHHIEDLVHACHAIPKTNNKPPAFTVVSSGTKSVIIAEKPVVIGERINPTGKKKLKEALEQENYDYIAHEAILQEKAGAQVLDLNVGIALADEKKLMKQAMFAIQKVSTLPLQIDSSDPVVLEHALRYYNGKALINSVNGKEESMHAIFPIAKKYGGVLVCLTLDEHGIPKTTEERIEIAKKIIQTAKSYGIEKQNLLMDTLTLTVSAQQKDALESLKALKMIREQLGVRTVLGLSNISFGLPNRELLNASFMLMALSYGCNALIMNPLSSEMMHALYAYRVIMNMDVSAKEYISLFGNEQANKQQPIVTVKSPEEKLVTHIIEGINHELTSLLDQVLSNQTPLDIVNKILIPALNQVGKRFEEGEIFIPQLLQSSDTANQVFLRLEKEILQTTGTTKEKHKIIMASVKGDVHDIGKNIVVSLLKNYGYEIIDLGKNVSYETILECAQQQKVKLIGLSALMTTTLNSMEETIQKLRMHWDGQIMVGGAVLTKKLAKEIGADFYGKDAMSAVHFAEHVFKKQELGE